MMGYDLERFVGVIDEELKCPICCGVLEDPMQGMDCEHAFCRKCIQQWMRNSETCPVDRQSLKPNQLQPIPRIVRNLLNHLQIKCDFAGRGCTEVIMLEELINHRQICPYNPEYPVPCTRNCGALVPKNQLDKHDCVRELRSIIINQQKELNDLKSTVGQLIGLAEEQRQISNKNNSSLAALADRYEHLKMSMHNLEGPIKQILSLATRSENDYAGPSGIKEKLAEETTTEVYISNVDRCVTATNLSDYLARNEVNVISCKEALCKGWKNDFRVTVFKSDSRKILQANLWPRGIVCFVCGEYYGTRTEGCLDPEDTNVEPALKASVPCLPPWMLT